MYIYIFLNLNYKYIRNIFRNNIKDENNEMEYTVQLFPRKQQLFACLDPARILFITRLQT